MWRSSIGPSLAIQRRLLREPEHGLKEWSDEKGGPGTAFCVPAQSSGVYQIGEV